MIYSDFAGINVLRAHRERRLSVDQFTYESIPFIRLANLVERKTETYLLKSLKVSTFLATVGGRID
jgi:hypothetical protein